MASLPTGTVTFVFTDIVNSTVLWERSPDVMADALERHDELLRKAFEGHGGYVFSTSGDAFAVVFSRAADAIQAAAAAQRAVLAEPGPRRPRL